MSLDDLRKDIKRNSDDASKLDEATSAYMTRTVWPFLEALLDEVSEVDDAVAELVDQQEDYLQPETAGLFAAVVQSSMQLAEELRKRAGGDAKILALISNHEQICEQAVDILGDITMIPTEEGTAEVEPAADAVQGGLDE